jgi:putative membrane protein (TIGR04086 family)
MPRPLRSVLAVLAGLAVMFVIVIACTLLSVALMHLKTGHPTPGYLVINVVYSLAAAVAGGWVAARLAGYRPVAHGVALALLMLVLSALSLLHPAPSQPFFYQLFLTIVPPLAAIGGATLAPDNGRVAQV